jgi:hypothetical protein
MSTVQEAGEAVDYTAGNKGMVSKLLKFLFAGIELLYSCIDFN